MPINWWAGVRVWATTQLTNLVQLTIPNFYPELQSAIKWRHWRMRNFINLMNVQKAEQTITREE